MINAKLNSDGTVKLSFVSESKDMTAAELDKQIALLASIRARMPDEVSHEPPPVQEVVINPLYRVRSDKITKACLLRIRHTALGWIDFELPAQEVVNMNNIWKEVVARLELDMEELDPDIPEPDASKLH